MMSSGTWGYVGTGQGALIFGLLPVGKLFVNRKDANLQTLEQEHALHSHGGHSLRAWERKPGTKKNKIMQRVTASGWVGLPLGGCVRLCFREKKN